MQRLERYKLIVITIVLLSTMYLMFLFRQSLLDRVNKSNVNIFNIDGMKFDKFLNGIPKLIHYMIDDEINTPIQYKGLMESCIKVNPDIKFVLWTDESILKLVKLYYPQKQLIYLSYLYNEKEKLKRFDVARPFIIYRYGGIYMDLDTKCLKPLRNVMISYKHSCMFTTPHEIWLMLKHNIRNLTSGQLIICIPYHNFFKYYIDNLANNDKKYILDSTGPFYIQNLFDKYNKLFANKLTSKHYYIGVGDWRIFAPILYLHLNKYCKMKGNWTFKSEACSKYDFYIYMNRVILSQAVLIHEGLSLGYSWSKVTKTFGIKVFNSSVILVQ